MGGGYAESSWPRLVRQTRTGAAGGLLVLAVVAGLACCATDLLLPGFRLLRKDFACASTEGSSGCTLPLTSSQSGATAEVLLRHHQSTAAQLHSALPAGMTSAYRCSTWACHLCPNSLSRLPGSTPSAVPPWGRLCLCLRSARKQEKSQCFQYFQ